MHADCILVVEDGMIVESGRHEELLRKGGRYASFYRLQLKEQASDQRAGRRSRLTADARRTTEITSRSLIVHYRPPRYRALTAVARRIHLAPPDPHASLMSTDTKSYVIAPPPQAALAVAGTDKLFPVRRLWCVGRNYVEHIKEMGQDVREPPFFFAKPADAIVPDGGTVPYPSLTKDMHHEVELVVALKSGGRNIPTERALACIYGYGVGIDLTRRDLQIASRDIKRPWEIGKAFDHSAPCGALKPASEIGHPSKGRIVLKVNGKVRQDGDLNQMIWNVPEIISKLSEMVELAAGDIIMTGTPSGVAATVAGDKIECEIEGVGKLNVTIGQPLK